MIECIPFRENRWAQEWIPDDEAVERKRVGSE